MRACAVEIHMNISQEPFCMEICKENAICPRSRNAHGHVTRAILCGHLQEKRGTLIPRHPFCASLRSRNTHEHFTRAILHGNLQGKCHMPRPRPTVCSSLRSRNAHGHVTRAILCGNLQGIGRTRMIPPRLNTGP